MLSWSHATGSIPLDRPRIVGILNVTPDSFSDARRQLDRLVEEGADIVDMGGESTRPQGAVEVTDDEELARVLPVIEAFLADHPTMPVSVDTTKGAVARRALDAGVSIVNDVPAFRIDAEMPRVCAQGKA